MAFSKNQGSRSKNVTERPVKFGDRAKVVNPRALAQVGMSMGNKAGTDVGKKVNPVEPFYQGRKPAGAPGGVPLGNEIATKGLGVGGGRKLYGQSGTNQQYGAANPGVPGLPSTKGQWPD
jgi:hypothetical protein